jgi:hypothetical protein
MDLRMDVQSARGGSTRLLVIVGVALDPAVIAAILPAPQAAKIQPAASLRITDSPPRRPT